MSLQNPDLYFFLSLLTGLAALLAIIYEGIRKFRRPPVVELTRWTMVDPPSPKHPPSRFSRFCESVKDLPPKEQARRLRDYFGIVGGARPEAGRGAYAQALKLNQLRNRFRRRFTPGEAQRLEQRSHTRL